MASGMMKLNYNPNASGWSLDNGYTNRFAKENYTFTAVHLGYVYLLSLLLKTYELNLDYTCGGMDQGFKLTVTAPGETLTPSRKYTRLPVSTKTEIKISSKVITASERVRELFVSLGIFTIPTFCFFLFEAVTFADYVNSFFFTSCGLLGISFNATLLWEKSNVNQLIVDLEDTFKQRRQQNPTLAKVYDDAKQVLESRTKLIHTIMLRASVPVIVLQFILWSFIQYIRSDYSNDSFHLIYPYVVPFNWRSPFGYMAIVPFQLIGILSCSEVCVIVLCLFTGLCLVMTTFVSDIEANLDIMNEYLLKANELNSTQQIELNNRLYTIIKFHSDAKESAMMFSKTFRKAIACYFTYATISISSLLLCINELRSVAAIQPAACLNVVLMWLFIYCYFGDEVTSRFNGIEMKNYLCNWYLLPLPLQKCLPIIILSTHKSIFLRGFGSTSCTRESFTKVVNVGFSYFTMLRRLSS
ncbi:uncharacterized protein LOC129572943 [Sitodiplosis mosellana]|uniref:uncharacterized protein LOC129572943 n=1 Tax=Sitodiplosis mosellana TaxID=263140 RepID=UPI002444B4CD|nr:uncharacterized protein LOC129572943 [Sitodiplosis mosellana]